MKTTKQRLQELARISVVESDIDDRKYALLRVAPRNYEDMIDKLQDMNINHTRHSGIEGVIKVYTDRIPDNVLNKLTHDVWVDKFVLNEGESEIILSNQILDFLQERGLITGVDAQKVHKELTAFIKSKI
jgi:hypothetical protein